MTLRIHIGEGTQEIRPLVVDIGKERTIFIESDTLSYWSHLVRFYMKQNYFYLCLLARLKGWDSSGGGGDSGGINRVSLPLRSDVVSNEPWHTLLERATHQGLVKEHLEKEK